MTASDGDKPIRVLAADRAGALGRVPARSRVLILEGERGLLDGLAAAVRVDPGLELVTAGGGESLADIAARVEPDVALVDSALGDPGGAEAIRELHAAAPDVRCVALGAGDDLADLVEMLAAGAAGCWSKAAPTSLTVEAIRSLSPDRVQIDREVAASLFGGLAKTLRSESPPKKPADHDERASRIREIIDERRFEMVFQPLVALQGGELLGLEALARFATEERRAPDMWLREAESAGLRCQLEEALLRAALANEAHLPPGALLTVNLSPQAAMSGVLERAVPASLLSRLVVEITEHQEVSDHGALAESLAAARADGLRVAVDDSGPGLSALHEILRLAPDFIKLNRALVRDIDREPTRRALAFALHSIAAQIGASVIAEGIETTAELQALRGLGIPYGQGYQIGRPEPLPQAASRVALPSSPGDRAAAPPILLPGRAMRSFRDAIRAAFGLLERELPGSGFVVAQLDHRTRRYRVLAASDDLARSIEPGFTIPLGESLCSHMASGRGARVCGDTALDAVYGALELQRRLDVASYVGVPLELEGAARLASLCAIAREPHRYDDRTLEMLQALAPVLMRALEDELTELDGVSAVDRLRSLSSTDGLTGTLNRLSFLEQLDTEAHGQTSRYPKKFVAHVEVDGIAGVHDQYGRAVGELVIKDLAEALVGAARASDSAGRLGEAEFGVVLVDREVPEQAVYHLDLVGQKLRETFAKRGVVVKARGGLIALDGTPGHEALAGARATAQTIT